jgi:mono/diheme cytochrome c family protein
MNRFLFALACACVFIWTLVATGYARQARPVTAGVYSSAQATRGQAVYKEKCATCHGDMLEGVIGPPLAGDNFLSVWAGRSMEELVDKIHKTMPLGAATLTREQSIDLAAYMLQASKFPAGQTDLANAALGQVTFAAAGRAAAPAAGGGTGPTFTAAANLAQLMRGVTFPNANIIFNVQVKDPGAYKPVPPVPFDYTLWGATVYYGWQAVDQAALSLIETTPLFLLEGRRCENGRPAPVSRADYKQYTQALIDVARDIYKASQTRSMDNVAGIAEKLNDACANCHKVYRDGAQEGNTAGANRCM